MMKGLTKKEKIKLMRRHQSDDNQGKGGERG